MRLGFGPWLLCVLMCLRIASRISTGRVLGVPCCDAPGGVSASMDVDRAELGARLARLSLAYEITFVMLQVFPVMSRGSMLGGLSTLASA